MVSLLRVLLIEQESDYKLIVAALQLANLNIKPHRVENKYSLKEAIATTQWDLILSSHQLAGCPPEEAVKLIRETKLDIPFLLVTRPISKDRLTSLFNAGIHGHIDIDNLYLLPSIIQHELSEASTRRKQIKDNKILYKSANSYRMLLENAPIPILLLRNRHVNYLNKLAKEALGLRDDVPFSTIEAGEIFIDPPDSLTSPHPANLKHTSPPIQTTFRRHDGQEIQVEAWSSRASHLDSPTTQIFFHDITNRITSIKQSQSQLEHLAHHDPLTDLPNRLLFEDRLEHAILLAKREQRHLAVMFLDLDRFKNINDSLGHAVGDALLVQVSKRLRDLLRENDTAARLGGDEFTILIENLEDPSYSAVIATKIQHQFKRPFDIYGRKLHITASIGISIYPEDGRNVGNLTKNADAAMYQAKENGRNNFRFYTSELTKGAFERLLLETELRSAVKDNQLLLYYQPQFCIETGKITGAEALLRWRHPRMGIITPGKFIPLAEETGLIHEIGHWTLEQACKQTRKWSQMGLFTGRMAVNLSVRQIMQSDLILRFEEIIKKTGCPPKQLEFEVTEGIFMSQKEMSVPVLDVFKQLGVSIAIDDFGTGYSSLSYLKHLPIDKLKIDRSFIKNMPDDKDDIAISQAIISLGQTLSLEIIAEGVETEAQQNTLKTMGCQAAQGYLYGAPMSAELFEKKLTSARDQPSQAISFFSVS